MTVEYHLTGTYKTGAAAPVSFDLRATARVIVLSDTRLWEFGVVAGKGGWIISLPGVVSGEEQFWVLEKSTDLVNWSPGDPGDTAVVVDDVLHWTPAFVPGSTRCFWRARLNYGG
jgi:hypothetical protein